MDRTEDAHWRALERMYLGSPINTIYEPSISVRNETAEISIQIQERSFHAAGAIHGSVTWKMLDDAAFFAAASAVDDVFVLTTSFTSYLTRPVSEGELRSLGRIVNRIVLRSSPRPSPLTTPVARLVEGAASLFGVSRG